MFLDTFHIKHFISNTCTYIFWFSVTLCTHLATTLNVQGKLSETTYDLNTFLSLTNLNTRYFGSIAFDDSIPILWKWYKYQYQKDTDTDNLLLNISKKGIKSAGINILYIV